MLVTVCVRIQRNACQHDSNSSPDSNADSCLDSCTNISSNSSSDSYADVSSNIKPDATWHSEVRRDVAIDWAHSATGSDWQAFEHCSAQLVAISRAALATRRLLHATYEPVLGIGRALGLSAQGEETNRTPDQQKTIRNPAGETT